MPSLLLMSIANGLCVDVAKVFRWLFSISSNKAGISMSSNSNHISSSSIISVSLEFGSVTGSRCC